MSCTCISCVQFIGMYELLYKETSPTTGRVFHNAAFQSLSSIRVNRDRFDVSRFFETFKNVKEKCYHFVEHHCDIIVPLICLAVSG